MSRFESLESRVLLSAATFLPVTIYRTVPNPRATVVADFNGDGHPDIAAAISANDLVAVLLNNADGTFTRAPYLHVGFPRAVAAADFARNGREDLVVTSNNGTNAIVDVFSGNGNGTFALPPQRYTLFGGGQSVAAVDLNGDGFPDIVVTTHARVAVLINQGNGTFAKPVYYASGNDHPSQLVVADFNKDGLPDLAVARGSTSAVSILLNNKNAPGTFGPPASYPAGGNPLGLTVGDFNHDGNLDLATVSSGFQVDALHVLLGNGDGTFRPEVPYSGPNFADAVATADFNGDGIPDLLVGNFTGPLRLYQGNGDGTFAPPVVVEGAPETEFLSVADLNADGRPDIIATPNGGVRVILNSTGTMTPAPPSGASDVTIGAGGTRSLAFFAPDGTKAQVSLQGPGAATLHFSSTTTIQIPSGRTTRPVTAMQLSSITATATTAASSLSIATSGGAHSLTFGSITTGGAFNSINAPSTNLTGTVSMPGGARQVSLQSANNGSITVGAGQPVRLALGQSNNETISSAAPIAALQVRLDLGAAVTAPSIRMLSVGGSLHDSTFMLTAPFAPGAFDLVALSAARGMVDVTVRSSGSINSIAAMDIIDSTIYAGIGPLAPGQQLPAAASDLVAPATIRAVRVGRKTNLPSFSNSVIAAGVEGNLDLGTIQMANGGRAFGPAAHSISVLLGTDLTTRRSFRLSGITSSPVAAAALAAKGINPQDFVVRIV